MLLEREAAGPLIPDFVLQPFDQELCDLLELKLPERRTVHGFRALFTLLLLNFERIVTISRIVSTGKAFSPGTASKHTDLGCQ
ncbi:MAG: hypothetical protein DMF60_06275 [Acidobacteria bacterium]|nr:MAG: hypothetical protein DMF60_06275 [Acidobacteriota bacterium]